jgi:hypothetical protein
MPAPSCTCKGMAGMQRGCSTPAPVLCPDFHFYPLLCMHKSYTLRWRAAQLQRGIAGLHILSTVGLLCMRQAFNASCCPAYESRTHDATGSRNSLWVRPALRACAALHACTALHAGGRVSLHVCSAGVLCRLRFHMLELLTCRCTVAVLIMKSMQTAVEQSLYGGQTSILINSQCWHCQEMQSWLGARRCRRSRTVIPSGCAAAVLLYLGTASDHGVSPQKLHRVS